MFHSIYLSRYRLNKIDLNNYLLLNKWTIRIKYF